MVAPARKSARLLRGRRGQRRCQSAELLDRFLSEAVPQLSRTRVQALPGPLKLNYHAVVDLSHHVGDPVGIAEVPVARLPAQVLGYIKWNMGYHAMLATPLGVRDILAKAQQDAERMATNMKMQAQKEAEDAKERATRDIEADVSFQNREKYTRMWADVRTRMARYINAAADEVAIVRNTSEANNIVVGGVPLKVGDDVLLFRKATIVDQLSRLNAGRVFYTSPDQMGNYIVVDYLANKRKRIGSR